ncbi:MAG: ribonuclease J [Eubacteriales bacterium]|nr:ribonuclease J [Eubacteriales bacterium]
MSKTKKVKVEKKQSNQQSPVQIIPLGGWREIGKNICVLRYQDDIIVIDSGLGFPADEMLGVDLVIPDFTYLVQNKDKVRGVFLTHGHEDHIGAIAWLMQEIDCPVYGLPLTLKLVAGKLDDRERGGSKRAAGALKARLKVLSCGEKIRAGQFTVEYVHVNHSIADAAGIFVETPVGNIYHSGDFKIDYTPVHGVPIDLGRIAQIGNSGLLAYIGESTNVEHPGFTPSERMVGESFSKLFSQVDSRIFVATFSSNVFRLQQIIQAAEEHGRKVGLLGFSMRKIFEAANSLGYLKFKPETICRIEELVKLPDNEILIISTGTQGEPMAALSRMAHNEHRQVDIKPGDTIFLSSSMIPGNEAAIYAMIDDLYLRGAEVIYHRLADIHVSGHAYRDELQLLLNLLRPKYFVPNHGEFRHLYKHGQLALNAGVELDKIFLLNNGDVLELSPDRAEITDFVEAGSILIDGLGVGDIDADVLRERRRLADDGLVSIVLPVDRKRNRLAAPARIEMIGFIYADEHDSVLKSINATIERFMSKQEKGKLADNLTDGKLRKQLKDLIYQNTKRRPIVMLQIIDLD